ncbi:MAG TPA: hypothetical protein VII38_11870 [Polyangia bacterium]
MRAQAGTMQGYRLVHQDEEVEVYELDTIEVADEDILCAEPAAEMRPSVQLRYLQVNEFLGQYLGRIRRGEPMVVPAPRGVERGDLVDVEIAIAQRERIILHAQVIERWPLSSSELAEVQFFAGRLTDRIVLPIAERALGGRLTARIWR